jgi:hypothetical protein
MSNALSLPSPLKGEEEWLTKTKTQNKAPNKAQGFYKKITLNYINKKQTLSL